MVKSNISSDITTIKANEPINSLIKTITNPLQLKLTQHLKSTLLLIVKEALLLGLVKVDNTRDNTWFSF